MLGVLVGVFGGIFWMAYLMSGIWGGVFVNQQSVVLILDKCHRHRVSSDNDESSSPVTAVV